MPNLWLAILSGAAVTLAGEKFNLVPLVLFFPYLLNRLVETQMKPKQALLLGFLTSFVVMLGSFYWIVYVIHEFGYLPWSISTLLFLGFCGFGALNFPVYLMLANYLHWKFRPFKQSKIFYGLWIAVGLPALFTMVEYFIPKLFPWTIGSTLYRQSWLIQIVELTGTSVLSFLLYSLSGSIGAVFIDKKIPRVFLAIPFTLLCFSVGFSLYRLNTFRPDGRTLRVALIQANIGSLEKVESRTGVIEKVNYVVEQHEKLTEEALKAEPKPDLILWPETALPFQLDGFSKHALRVKEDLKRWNVSLIAGGYSQSPTKAWKDYNTAFFLEPQSDGSIRMEKYFKIILLAFGEYLPLGEFYPKMYRWFPQIGGFERGTSREPFILADGTRLGINICYEAILPEFYRQGALRGVNGVINLTNDSWFGPTSEPYLHGSLTAFRAIETRTPLFRVTNTGTSFTVDSLGHLSDMTPVYKQAVLRSDLVLPKTPPHTIYLAYGDWFIGLMGFVFSLILTALWKRKRQ